MIKRMTEKEKMLAGEVYSPDFGAASPFSRARLLCSPDMGIV